MSRLDRMVQRMAASPRFARVAPPVLTRVDRFLYRVFGTRTALTNSVIPRLLLTTTGARSGEARTVPLATYPVDDELYLVGSNFGRDHHPAWSYNLLAHPRARVDFRGERFDVSAELLTDDEKAAVWPRLVAAWPPVVGYQERSGRDLRVFRLRRN